MSFCSELAKMTPKSIKNMQTQVFQNMVMICCVFLQVLIVTVKIHIVLSNSYRALAADSHCSKCFSLIKSLNPYDLMRKAQRSSPPEDESRGHRTSRGRHRICVQCRVRLTARVPMFVCLYFNVSMHTCVCM